MKLGVGLLPYLGRMGRTLESNLQVDFGGHFEFVDMKGDVKPSELMKSPWIESVRPALKAILFFKSGPIEEALAFADYALKELQEHLSCASYSAGLGPHCSSPVAEGRPRIAKYRTSGSSSFKAWVSAAIDIYEHRPPLCGGCMTLKLVPRDRHLWCCPTRIRGTTWLGS